jgi:hypothetical protein
MARPKDETYIIDLCDDVLGMKAHRGYTFDFLRGDPGKSGTRTRLPVDAYYPELKLVVEYNERQHFEPVRFFDKKPTLSGIPRGEQRKKYYLRRQEMLPKHGIVFIAFDFSDFSHNAQKRLRRIDADDREVISARLTPFLPSHRIGEVKHGRKPPTKTPSEIIGDENVMALKQAGFIILPRSKLSQLRSKVKSALDGLSNELSQKGVS